MSFLVFSGIMAFVSGLMFILFPEALSVLAELTNRLAANVDGLAFKYRLGIGISFILTAACLWFIAYYMRVMPIISNLG